MPWPNGKMKMSVSSKDFVSSRKLEPNDESIEFPQFSYFLIPVPWFSYFFSIIRIYWGKTIGIIRTCLHFSS